MTRSYFLVVLAIITSPALAQERVSCNVDIIDAKVTVNVSVATPHADHMLIVLPDDRRIYLRDSDTPVQHPDVPDFPNLEKFTLDATTRGTWFNDWGESEIVGVIGQSGTYRLLIDDDLDGRMTGSNSCSFTIAISGD